MFLNLASDPALLQEGKGEEQIDESTEDKTEYISYQLHEDDMLLLLSGRV